MTRILVTGGSGVLGRDVVRQLTTGEPAGHVDDFGGPLVPPVGELARAWPQRVTYAGFLRLHVGPATRTARYGQLR